MSLTLERLKKSYTGPDGSIVPVIDIASLAVGAAEEVALVGSSGCGKTTLLHLIAGILVPDSGRILFDFGDGPGGVSAERSGQVLDYHGPGPGLDITCLSEAQRDVFRGRYIGYIFQTHHLLPGFTALENVLLGMSFTGRRHDRAWAVHCWKKWDWPTGCTTGRRSFRWASSSAWRWPGRWLTGRSWCWRTNRQARWIRATRSRCWS
jgi:ABC-type antimicrobial peptide transport system, ATPase component